MKLIEQVREALEQGVNKRMLMLCVQMDEQEFDLCVEYNKFNYQERKALKECLENWNNDTHR